MIADRWKIALHESGHAVSAIVLGGKCNGLVVFADGEGGVADVDELLGSRDAFMVAAGPRAESLAAEYPVPNVAIVEQIVSVDTLENLPIFSSSPHLACAMARTPETRKHSDSDDRRIALWAISGNEDSPESWAGRVAHAKRVAAEIVERNAATIVRVATALFERGSLCRDEITELLTKSNEGKRT